VTVSGAGGWSASPVPFTIDGTAGPASAVLTVKVAKPASAAGAPVPLTVAASADGLTAQTTASVLPFGQWPAGTTATASSYHSPNTVNGQVRIYVPGNAIDRDFSTFWNDASPATYPAVLTITSPSAVTLSGVDLASFIDGVPVEFTIATWNGSTWVQQAQVTGNDQADRWIPFAAPVTASSVRFTATLDQNTDFKDYLRSGPVFDDLDLGRTAERPRSTDWASEA
jgi:alpha-L-rhamnosidase